MPTRDVKLELEPGAWMLASMAPGKDKWTITFIGDELFCGKSRHDLNPAAKYSLGPQIMQAVRHGQTRLAFGEFNTKPLITKVVPIPDPYSGRVLAVLGAYLYRLHDNETLDEAASRFPEPPLVGAWWTPVDLLDGHKPTFWTIDTFKLFGRNPADAKTIGGRHYWDTVQVLTDIISPEDALGTLRAMAKWACDRKYHEHPYSIQAPDGPPTYIRAVGSADEQGHGISGILHEISPEAYINSRDASDDVITAAFLLHRVFFVDPEGKVVTTLSPDARAEDLALSEKQLLADICDEDGLSRMKETFAKLSSSPGVNRLDVPGTVSLLTTNGKWKEFEIGVVATRLANNVAATPLATQQNRRVYYYCTLKDPSHAASAAA